MRYLIVIVFINFFSCENYFKSNYSKNIARVDDEKLTIDESIHIYKFSQSKEDSILILNNFINDWATNKLLTKGALINLPKKKLDEINKMSNDYKSDLLIDNYIDVLTSLNINTNVTQNELDSLYNKTFESFKLNERLFKYRYLYLPKINPDIKSHKSKLLRFNDEDKFFLDSISFQFYSFSLSDSLWVNKAQFIQKIPLLKSINQKLLKKSNFIEIKDSLGLYLIKISDVLNVNDDAPIEYVSKTLKRIIINNRKSEYINKLKKDITRDAIKNKSFETYK